MLAQSAVDVLDEVLLLFDQAISGRESAAQAKLTELLAEHARRGEDRQRVLDEILAGSARSRGRRRGGRACCCANASGWSGCGRRGSPASNALPRDHGHLAMLDASMSYLRQFAPTVLGAVRFAGGPGTEDLVYGVSVLSELYATGARKVPADAPTGFVPTRWAGYLTAASESGDVTAYRHYWELCVLMALRDGLRAGDIYVPGSRRYADPIVVPAHRRAVGTAAGGLLPRGRETGRVQPMRWRKPTRSCTPRSRI